MAEVSLREGEALLDRVPTTGELAMWATGHERLCGERHGMTALRLGRIEKVGLAIAGAVITGGAVMLWELFKISAHIMP